MMELEVLRKLTREAGTKIVLLVMDGLGGIGCNEAGQTALEAARTPRLDALAREGVCGLHLPVAHGITPGSGPGHLALFGYDPLTYEVGRGVLSALGIGFDLRPGDVAVRGNFATVDEQGRVVDRRAGRIDTETNQRLCERLRRIELPGIEVFIETVKEHRFLLVLRGEGLDSRLNDTDPQATGVPPREVRPQSPVAEKTARAVGRFLREAGEILRGEESGASMVLLRGFASLPSWPKLPEVTAMRAAAIAGYPMYRGIGALLGMTVVASEEPPADKMRTLARVWDEHDFFFVHIKKTDSAGEDGDFERKVKMVEEVDRSIPALMDLKPDVVVVTGDHSTPARLRSHSWHPVPVLLRADSCRPDGVGGFGERECASGSLGASLPGCALLPLALAHAHRLQKFGA